jgi:hypothetical protein
MLKVNTSLKWLILSKNPIGNDGAIALAKTLKEVNRSLKWLLLLSNNSIGNKGAIALVEMSRVNMSLVWLIRSDLIGKKGQSAINNMNDNTLKSLVDDPDPMVSEKAKALPQKLSKFKKVKRSITRRVEKSHRRKNKSKTKSGPKRSSNRKNY